MRPDGRQLCYSGRTLTAVPSHHRLHYSQESRGAAPPATATVCSVLSEPLSQLVLARHVCPRRVGWTGEGPPLGVTLALTFGTWVDPSSGFSKLVPVECPHRGHGGGEGICWYFQGLSNGPDGDILSDQSRHLNRKRIPFDSSQFPVFATVKQILLLSSDLPPEQTRDLSYRLQRSFLVLVGLRRTKINPVVC